MKRIPLKSLPDPRFTAGTQEYEANLVDYRAVIEQAVRVPLDRQAGASIDEMRKGIRVLDALEDSEPGLHPDADDVLVLEDADWDYLKTKVEKMPWSMVDRRFVEFYDDVMGAHNGLVHPD